MAADFARDDAPALLPLFAEIVRPGAAHLFTHTPKYFGQARLSVIDAFRRRRPPTNRELLARDRNIDRQNDPNAIDANCCDI